MCNSAPSMDFVVDRAKNTLLLPNGLTCQIQHPEICGVVLVSWEAYRLHLIRHHCATVKKVSKHQQASGSMVPREFRCPFQCNNIHLSHNDLEEHILVTHMFKVALRCPFQRCSNVSPLDGLSKFLEHVANVHSHNLNGLQPEQGEQWLSLWQPFDTQSNVDIDPPPLPTSSVYLDIMNPYSSHITPPRTSTPVPGPSTPPPRIPSMPLTPRAHIHSRDLQLPALNSPGHRVIRPRQIAANSQMVNREDEENTLFTLDDLPVLEQSHLLPGLPPSKSPPRHTHSYRRQRTVVPKDWLTWKRPKPLRKELSTPVFLPNPADHGLSPPPSMDFNVFSTRVDQLRGPGFLDK